MLGVILARFGGGSCRNAFMRGKACSQTGNEGEAAFQAILRVYRKKRAIPFSTRNCTEKKGYWRYS